ncbi:MAG: malonyl-ACP O-methyltransferase BioC [Candidatus Omnitrophota bacterium]
MSKILLAKNFSRYAQSYDDYCAVQDLCARELICKIGPESFGSILDIGCGTGNFTRLLKTKFPYAGITAMDISRDMLKIARAKLRDGGIEFLEEDAETVALDKRFDLISSNATLQWMEDLDRSLASYRHMLREDGMIWFSIFGRDTFCELNTAMQEIFGKEARVSASCFVGADDLGRMMNRLFRNVSIEERRYQESYSSLKELLDTIRFTGTRGWGANNGAVWTRKRMEGLERAYLKRFGGIRATYQVFFCGGNR